MKQAMGTIVEADLHAVLLGAQRALGPNEYGVAYSYVSNSTPSFATRFTTASEAMSEVNELKLSSAKIIWLVSETQAVQIR